MWKFSIFHLIKSNLLVNVFCICFQQREFIDNTVDDIVKKVAAGNEELQYVIEKQFEKFHSDMFDCYRPVYRLFSDKCFDMNMVRF